MLTGTSGAAGSNPFAVLLSPRFNGAVSPWESVAPNSGNEPWITAWAWRPYCTRASVELIRLIKRTLCPLPSRNTAGATSPSAVGNAR
jgi:hypothetical protein